MEGGEGGGWGEAVFTLHDRRMPLSSASRNNVTLAQASKDNRVFADFTGCANADPAKGRACLVALELKQVTVSVTDRSPVVQMPDASLSCWNANQK